MLPDKISKYAQTFVSNVHKKFTLEIEDRKSPEIVGRRVVSVRNVRIGAIILFFLPFRHLIFSRKMEANCRKSKNYYNSVNKLYDEACPKDSKLVLPY